MLEYDVDIKVNISPKSFLFNDKILYYEKIFDHVFLLIFFIIFC